MSVFHNALSNNSGLAGRGPKVAAAMLVAAVLALTPVYSWAAGSDAEVSRVVVMADFNRDGIADMAEALPGENSGAATLKVSLGNASGGFRPATSVPLPGRNPRAIVAADFDGDGIPDVIVGDDDGTIRLFLGDGSGNLAPAVDVARLDSVVSIAVADFNSDGRPDIAVSDWRDGTATMFLATGQGGFTRGWSFRLRMPGAVARLSAADFNGDGIPDLAVVYGDDEQYTFDVMLGNGKGVFVHSPELSFTRDPNSHCPA